MPIGTQTGQNQTNLTGSTFDHTLTRDRLIELAHSIIGVLEPGQALDAQQLRDGIDLLGLIVRETDASGKWLWTIERAASLSLQSSVHRYSVDNGLPTNISEILTASYRDATGRDVPISIVKHEQYETISDKLAVGAQPAVLYLTEPRDLATRELYLCPALSSVTTGHVVQGSDNAYYKCIYPHTASSANQPTLGGNWPMVWAATTSTGSPWVSGTDYTATEQIRFTYRRPIYDFDAADDTPDFPIAWPRELLYKLAFDLGDLYSIPLDERTMMVNKAKGAFNDIFPSTRGKGQRIHNKVSYF